MACNGCNKTNTIVRYGRNVNQTVTNRIGDIIEVEEDGEKKKFEIVDLDEILKSKK